MNENLLATLIVLLAVGASALGLDDGSLIRMVISAYLGFLTAKGIDKVRKGGTDE